jgi:enoyl-[acyl-carrier protein] reductase I
MALDISSYSLIALVNALHERLNDGASIMALTYLGATAIVPNYNIAGISKAALESIVRYLAFDLGGRGIRVNAISAGPIKTASSRQVGGFSRILDVVPKVAPLRRNITQDDVGKTAVYLASDLSTSITADVHFVDAGYHAMGMYPPSLSSE